MTEYILTWSWRNLAIFLQGDEEEDHPKLLESPNTEEQETELSTVSKSTEKDNIFEIMQSEASSSNWYD